MLSCNRGVGYDDVQYGDMWWCGVTCLLRMVWYGDVRMVMCDMVVCGMLVFRVLV